MLALRGDAMARRSIWRVEYEAASRRKMSPVGSMKRALLSF
jgi:hypothetical protein